MSHSHQKALSPWLASSLALLLSASLAACGGAGTGKAVRADVTKQMSSIEAPAAACYKEALTRSRKIKGTIVLAFKIEPKTGKFKSASIVRSDVDDAALESCVVAEVSKLVLSKPQSTVVGIDTYPIRFAPSN
jgi:hypothetical protein